MLTLPCRHWLRLTMMTPRADASESSASMAGFCGALPTPKESRISARTGCCRMLAITSAEMPG
ncbi:hypothetical protein D3C85_1799940 [compost metagenome]